MKYRLKNKMQPVILDLIAKKIAENNNMPYLGLYVEVAKELKLRTAQVNHVARKNGIRIPNYINKTELVLRALKGYSLLTSNKIAHGTLATIAQKLAISRERVRQIALKNGYIMPTEVSIVKRTKNCINCNKIFLIQNLGFGKKCCSPECYKEYYLNKYWKTKKCEYCNKDIKYRKKLDNIGRTPRFCGKICQGKWLAKKYGFNSENATRQATSHKSNASSEFEKMLKNLMLPEWFDIWEISMLTKLQTPNISLKLRQLRHEGKVLMKQSSKDGRTYLYKYVITKK